MDFTRVGTFCRYGVVGYISCALLLSTIFLCSFNKSYAASEQIRQKFSPRTEVSVKGGNHRSIFRPGLLIPLHQDDTSLVHGSAFLMGDTTKSVEGNFGLGCRKRVGDQAFGGYGFYDIRRTTNKNVIHQATVGIEYLRSHMEFRANVYLPSTKKFVLNSFSTENYRKADGHKRVEVSSNSINIFEQALRGFDVEIGGQLPGLEDLSARAAYYHFGFSSDKNVSTKQGVRFGLSYSILDMLSIDGEYSYTANSEVKKDKHTVFGGLTFSYNFGKTKPSHQTRLERKMNSLPIRDIDAVVGTGETHNMHTAEFELSETDIAVVAIKSKKTVHVLKNLDGILHVLESKAGTDNNSDDSEQISQEFNRDKILQDNSVIVLGIASGGEILDINQTRLSTGLGSPDEAEFRKRAVVFQEVYRSATGSNMPKPLLTNMQLMEQKALDFVGKYREEQSKLQQTGLELQKQEGFIAKQRKCIGEIDTSLSTINEKISGLEAELREKRKQLSTLQTETVFVEYSLDEGGKQKLCACQLPDFKTTTYAALQRKYEQEKQAFIHSFSRISTVKSQSGGKLVDIENNTKGTAWSSSSKEEQQTREARYKRTHGNLQILQGTLGLLERRISERIRPICDEIASLEGNLHANRELIRNIEEDNQQKEQQKLAELSKDGGAYKLAEKRHQEQASSCAKMQQMVPGYLSQIDGRIAPQIHQVLAELL